MGKYYYPPKVWSLSSLEGIQRDIDQIDMEMNNYYLDKLAKLPYKEKINDPTYKTLQEKKNELIELKYEGRRVLAKMGKIERDKYDARHDAEMRIAGMTKMQKTMAKLTGQMRKFEKLNEKIYKVNDGIDALPRNERLSARKNSEQEIISGYDELFNYEEKGRGR